LPAQEIPANIVYEDEQCVAFSDLNPQAPTHLLVVPKRRIALLQDATKDDAALLGHLMLAAAEAARIANLDAGYRVIVNNGYDGLQSVRRSAPHVAAREPPSWHFRANSNASLTFRPRGSPLPPGRPPSLAR
jgi:histidine triad (HIT) family protein